MKNTIKREILNKKDFSTQVIGPLCYLVHKMSGKGNYILQVFKGKSIVAELPIACSENYASYSKNIDLSDPKLISKTSSIKLNSEAGYILLYNSREFSASRIVIRQKNKIEFDSHNPSKDDLYALNFFRPGIYEFSTGKSKTKLKCNIKYPTLSDSVRKQSVESVNLKTTDLDKNKTINMMPNQTVVIPLDNGMKKIDIRMIQENQPPKGYSLPDQIKKEAKKYLKNNTKIKDKKNLHKYRWEGPAKHNK